MNTIYRLTILFALTLSALGADVKFSALPTATSPSTNTYIPIIDLNLLPAAQNEKYLLTNLATVAYVNSVTNQGLISGLVSNNVASAGLLAVDATKTNGIAATSAMVTNALGYTPVNKAGDTMTGALTVPTLTATNSTFTGPATFYGNPTANYYVSTNGFWIAGAGMQIGGTGGFYDYWGQNVGIKMSTAEYLGWGANLSSPDLYLYRDAANTLALRNGVNSQAFTIYNTYTDASNYERAMIYFFSNDLYISGQKAGTGSSRNMYVGAYGTILGLYTGNNTAAGWKVDTGHFIPGANGTLDVGSAAAKARSVYVGTSVLLGTNVLSFSGTNLTWNGGTVQVTYP